MYALTVHAKNQTKMDQTNQSEARGESSIKKKPTISIEQMRLLVRDSGKRTFAERHASDSDPAGGGGYTDIYHRVPQNASDDLGQCWTQRHCRRGIDTDVNSSEPEHRLLLTKQRGMSIWTPIPPPRLDWKRSKEEAEYEAGLEAAGITRTAPAPWGRHPQLSEQEKQDMRDGVTRTAPAPWGRHPQLSEQEKQDMRDGVTRTAPAPWRRQ